MTRATRDPDAGDTLIEVLLALVIIAVCVVALMTGLLTSISGSSTHRSLSTIDTVLKSYAETMKSQVELQTNPPPLFAQCAQVTATTYQGATVAYTPPTGYTVAIKGIEYWNSTTSQFDSVSSAACQANPQDQSGFQLLILKATDPHNGSQLIELGVRTPS
ncbi:MAG TPA: hypothetical protein VGZ03_11515 [Acidimicrobiales bacterium]|jgi:Tfp pilus assembly protein PilV|nr:hypothetical protein [Acidimicrobiales bacterium]